MSALRAGAQPVGAHAHLAYHIGLGPVPFVSAGVLLFAIALATVSTQALRAATTDPVNALRYE